MLKTKLALIAAISAAMLGSAAAQTVLKVGHGPNVSSLDLQYAIKKGFFKEAGLDVSYEVLTAGSQAIPQLLGGQLQFAAVDTIVTLQARNRGINVISVAPNTVGSTDPKRGYANLMVRGDSPIKTLKDIAGKTIAVNQINGSAWAFTRATLDSQGVDSTTVKFVEVPPPQLWTAVSQKQTDVGMVAEPGVTIGLNEGGRIIANIEAYAIPNLPAFTFIGTEDWVKSNMDAVKKFNAGIMRAHKELQDHAVAVAFAKETVKLPPGVKIEDIFFPPFAQGQITVEQMKKISDMAVKYGLLPADKVPAPGSTFVSGL
jgi:ABC-type nitrate/sulfonate/bicarbonate transport system substrate-binding protein